MRAIRRRRAWAATMASVAAVTLPATARASETVSQSFTTSGEHAFVVPPGVSSLQVTLVGGAGGAGNQGAPGGTGATVTATLAVTPGETLYAEVGGDGEGASGGSEGLGGYGGGGEGGEHEGFLTSEPGGGGGGGASDLRTCSTSAAPSACGGLSALASRLLVAGGGGGGGGAGRPVSVGAGSGGPADGSGFAGKEEFIHADEGGSGGTRGTASAGGAAGSPSWSCASPGMRQCSAPGQLGVGGQGGTAPDGGGGGGGGGGIFGGGGAGGGAATVKSITEVWDGGGGGGGGGASGVPAGAIGVSNPLLLATPEGATPTVSFSWSAPPPTVLTAAVSGVADTMATLNGSVNSNDWQPTGCSFEIAPAVAGQSTLPCAQQLAAAGTPTPVSATAAGLSPQTTYSVALVASTVQGVGIGATVTFTTPAVSAGTRLGVGNLRINPSRFRRGNHTATLATARRKKNAIAATATISFALSEAATVRLAFESVGQGVLVRHRCIAISRTRRKGRRCNRYARIAHGVSRPAPGGTDKITFDGVLDGGARLAPGTYRLSLTATAAGISVTAAQHPTFTLVS